MRRRAAAGIVALLTALGSVAARAQTANAAAPVVVPALTPVTLRMSQVLSSDRVHTGDRFRFTVADDVRIAGVVVIPAGSEGEGEVIHAVDSGGRNEPGELVLAARHVLVGDQKIRLRSFVAGAADRANDALAVPPFDRHTGGGRGDDVRLGKGGLATARTVVAVQLPAAEEREARYGASLPESTQPFAGDDSGLGTVVFFREREQTSSARREKLRERGQVIMEIPNGSYVEMLFAAGIHRFGSKTEDDIRLEIDSGETYYVACVRESLRLNCSPSNRRMFELVRSGLHELR